MASTEAGLCLATNSAAVLHNAKKLSFLVTKSVSQFTSINAPCLPSMKEATIPSAVTRVAALPALLPNLTRRISSAFSMLPSASVRAFLHSIMGASVLARSSPTIAAVIAIFFLRCVRKPFVSFGTSYKKGAISPLQTKQGALGGRAVSHFHKLVFAFCRGRLCHG